MHSHAIRGTARVALVSAVAAAAAAATLLLTGTPAHAAGLRPTHVKIDGTAQAGTTSTIAFRAPNESADGAATTSLTIDVPADALITSVSPLYKAGWDVKVVSSDLNPPVTNGNIQLKSDITEIVWTATGGGIPPQTYDTFTVRIGIPDAGMLAFPAHQGYSDGTVVDWDEPTNADGTEPAHPAPTIDVAPAVATPGGLPTTTAEEVGSSAAGPALGIGIAALVIAAAGLVIAILSLLRRRRGATV